MSGFTPMPASRAARKTAAIMFPVVEKYLASGLSQKAFCDQHKLPAASLSYWLRKYRKAHAGSPAVPAPRTPDAFVPIRITATSSTQSACELVFPNGVTVRFSHPVEPGLFIQLIHRGALHAWFQLAQAFPSLPPPHGHAQGFRWPRRPGDQHSASRSPEWRCVSLTQPPHIRPVKYSGIRPANYRPLFSAVSAVQFRCRSWARCLFG